MVPDVVFLLLLEKAKARRAPKKELNYVHVQPKAPLRRPFEEKFEESRTGSIFKDTIFKEEPIKIESKEPIKIESKEPKVKLRVLWNIAAARVIDSI